MTFKNYILKMLCVLFCIILTACGNSTKSNDSSTEQSKEIDENTILSLIPDAEEYINQYKKKGLSVDGQTDESLFRGLWHNDKYYRTQIDLSGLEDEQPIITVKYTDEFVKNGYLIETSSDDIYNRFSYLFEPMSVYLDNFKWSVNDERELIEKLIQNCIIEEITTKSGSKEKRYICDYTENSINYSLNFKNTSSSLFTETNAMSFSVKIIDTSIKYNELQKLSIRPKKISDSLSRGDVVEFGSYEQDDNEDNGKENIEWYVLKVENNKALLLSKYILDGMSYKNSDDFQIFCDGWHESDVRSWLNGTFYNASFTDEEKNAILLSDVKYETFEATSLVASGTVKDKIFILDNDEIPEELYIKIAFTTEYASYKVMSQKGMIGSSLYWYKNDGINLGSVVSSLGNKGVIDFKYFCGVRPVMWVNFGG